MKIGRLRIYVYLIFSGGVNIKDYYVYAHIRLDNNTCFYIGKGHGKRYLIQKRNEHHDRIVKKYGMKAVIIKDGLSEEEAYNLERLLIFHYVFDLEYGIDINGYRKDKCDKFLTNQTFGGDGSFGMVHSDEWGKKHSERMKGSNNPMYGINLCDTFSESKANEIKRKIKEKTSGDKNAMYGVSPKDRMDLKTYQKWYDKTSNRCKQQKGAKNPNYKNDTLKKKLIANPELKAIYYPPKYGSCNSNSKIVRVYKNNIFIARFDSIIDCSKWLKSELKLSSKISSISGSISYSSKSNKTYHGFIFYVTKQ